MPLWMSGAKQLEKKLYRLALVANDVLSDESFKSSLKTRSKETGKKLAIEAVKKVDEMIGQGRFKRKRKLSKHFIPSKVRKVQRRDIFD